MLTARSQVQPRPVLLRSLAPVLGLLYLVLMVLVIPAWAAIAWTDPIHRLLTGAAALSWVLHAWGLAKIIQHHRPSNASETATSTAPLAPVRLRTAASLYGVLLWTPTLVAHLVALAGAGLSASELTQIGLKAGGGLLALACALAVLAALTPDKSLFALGCLVALGSWGGIRWIVLAVFRHRWGAELGEHLFVSWLAFVLLMLAITMSLCLVFLYRGQARGRALGLTGLFLLIVMVVVVVWTGGLFWLGPGHPSPPSIQLHPPSQTLDLSTPEGTLRVEPEIGYRPNKTFYRLLHTQVRLDGIDGSSWNLTQIHEKGSTEGPTLGFYPAMKEALTDVPAAVKFADLVILEPPRAAASHLRLLTEDTFLLGKPPLKVRVQGRSLVEERQLRWLGVLSAAGSSRIQERELWAQLSSAPSSSTPQIVAQSLHSGNEKCQPVFLLLKPGGEPQERIDVESELVQNTAHNLPLPLPYPSIIRKSLSLAPPGSLPARNLQFGVIESCAVARRLARLTDQAYTIRPTP